jgi:hypothetical protein
MSILKRNVKNCPRYREKAYDTRELRQRLTYIRLPYPRLGTPKSEEDVLQHDGSVSQI